MRRLLPAVAVAALAWPAGASAELVAAAAADGALAVAPDGTARVAWLDEVGFRLGTRGTGGWESAAVPVADARQYRIAALAAAPSGRVFGLLATRERLLLVEAGPRPRTPVLAEVQRAVSELGPPGLALDRRGLPAVAFAVRRPATGATELWLVRMNPRGRLVRTRVTRKGFPPSLVAPAAAPVLLPDGSIRVVETFTQRGANAILWRREGKRWWGRVLHASTLGSSGAPVYAAAAAAGVYVAWTVAYGGSEIHVVLSSHVGRSRSVVLHRLAAAAALVLGPNGPEVAANEPIDFPPPAGYLAGAVSTELDGRILGYAAAGAGRQLLLWRGHGLEWFALPTPPSVHLTLAQDFTGRLDGAPGGVVELYLEELSSRRTLVGTAVAAADGSFAFPVAAVPGVYRAVYVDPATGLPYGAKLYSG